MRDARRELGNIAAAIRAGVITATTKTMLEDAERRVAGLEQAAREAQVSSAPAVSVEIAVKRYLTNLRAALSRNVDEAQRMLSITLDKILLRNEGEHVVARITGNMAGLLRLGGSEVAMGGAGRGIRELATWPPVPLVASP